MSEKKIGITKELLRAFAQGLVDQATDVRVIEFLAQRPELWRQVSAISTDQVRSKLAASRKSGKSETGETAASRSTLTSESPRSGDSAGIPSEFAELTEFRLIRELGRGGMGVVYLAEHILTKRLEVLKLLARNLMTHTEARQRFEREAQVICALDHESIVRCYSVKMLRDTIVLSMEYLSGGDLSGLLEQEGRMSVSDACRIAADVAGGLQHAMERNAIHRDIKPSNIMLYESEGRMRAKITDFGLGRLANRGQPGLTEDGRLMGTLEFISPEQSLDAARADIRSDIYSLGCTLFFMLADQPPFSGTHGELILAHNSKTPPDIQQIRADVPAELSRIVTRMMAKDPADRFQTPQEVVLALTPYAPLKRNDRVWTEKVSDAATGKPSGSKSAMLSRTRPTPRSPQPGVLKGASRESAISRRLELPISSADSQDAVKPEASSARSLFRRWWLMAAGVAVTAAAGLVIVLFSEGPRDPNAVVPVADPTVAPAAAITTAPPVADASVASIPAFPVGPQPSISIPEERLGNRSGLPSEGRIESSSTVVQQEPAEPAADTGNPDPTVELDDADKRPATVKLPVLAGVERNSLVPEPQPVDEESRQLVEEAMVALREGDQKRVREKLKKASNTESTDFLADYLLGLELCVNSHDPSRREPLEEASRYFRKVLRKSEFHAGAMINLAVCEFTVGDRERAINLWEDAASVAPENPELLHNLGRAVHEIGQRTIRLSERETTQLTKLVASLAGPDLAPTQEWRLSPPVAPFWMCPENGKVGVKPRLLDTGIRATGICVAADYFLTSSQAVLHPMTGIPDKITIRKGEQEYVADVVSASKDADLALLRCEGLQLLPVRFATVPAAIGQKAVAFGFPGTRAAGTEIRRTPGAVTDISATTDPHLQYDCILKPANAGGPFADPLTAEIISVHTIRRTERKSGGVPAASVVRFLQAHLPGISHPTARVQSSTDDLLNQVADATVLLEILSSDAAPLIGDLLKTDQFTEDSCLACRGTGQAFCGNCSGNGTVQQSYVETDIVGIGNNRRAIDRTKYRKLDCPSCERGRVACPHCRATGISR